MHMNNKKPYLQKSRLVSTRKQHLSANFSKIKSSRYSNFVRFEARNLATSSHKDGKIPQATHTPYLVLLGTATFELVKLGILYVCTL
ncbi:Hypothetical protein NTJ_00960 [Nesidiocoris tenuis]|uniref:Uncharacterized protein n=1 Tax=Nesidiocoris tenuis TaxID=355587 RepID=A0ABN7AAI0_9HEMI|nr:Hypothetical protein NTJ_00960 [Nesidiocoris tenuis]